MRRPAVEVAPPPTVKFLPLAEVERTTKGLNMLREETANIPSLGVVVSVRGSVVDVRFDKHLPPIYSVLRAGAEKQIVIEVLAQLDARHVRGIALTPTQGLARGMAVEDTGGPLKAPVGKADSLADVRRVWQYHRPRSGTVRCPMAFGASGSAAAGATLHQVGNL